jgi:hypothetical protein
MRGLTPLAPPYQRSLRIKVERDHSFARSRRGDGKRCRQRGLSRSAFLRKQCNGAHFDSHYIRHTVTLSQNADCEKLWR